LRTKLIRIGFLASTAKQLVFFLRDTLSVDLSLITHLDFTAASARREYRVLNTNVQRSPTGMEDPKRGLNQRGMEGVELVHFIREDGMSELRGTWIFKRPK
jgi:hypothetical protein